MKTKKWVKITKTLALILVAVMAVFSFTACGGESENTENSSIETVSTENNSSVKEETIEDTPIKHFEYKDLNGAIKIMTYSGSAKVIKIPSIIANKKVTSIDSNCFAGNINIETMILSDYMTELNFAHFKNCESLKKIIGNGVTNVTNYGGFELPSITELQLGEILSISRSYFSVCPNLKKLIAPKCEIIDSSFSSKFMLYYDNDDSIIDYWDYLKNDSNIGKYNSFGNLEELVMKDTPKFFKLGKKSEDYLNEYEHDSWEYKDDGIYANVYYYYEEYIDSVAISKDSKDTHPSATESAVTTTPEEEQLYQSMSDSDISKYVCSAFGKDKIKINGVTYESTERYIKYSSQTKRENIERW